ncbi:PAS domain-containing protein [Maricaulis sp.]|uniref:PAS domain-containing protein n=1 Tax=Maricaulis sp. TaxID=1486257 RepID=UPI003296D67E
MTRDVVLTGAERFFGEDEIIVSKTDLKGRLTYCNDVFLRISGYTEKECLGQPHSLIRHPQMPRCVFKLLWDTVQGGHEIFAYVLNRSKNGDHYWVDAHVTPSRDKSGEINGYHSNRRVADPSIIGEIVWPLYRELLAEEQRHTNRRDGLAASTSMISKLLEEKALQYDEFIARVRAA